MKNKNLLHLKGLLQKASDGRVEFIASDETVDRSGESIPASSWDLTNFLKAPRLLADHDYNINSILGVCENVRVEDGKLLFSPKFHEITELAKTAARMVAEGILNTVSVGFMRKSDKKGNVTNELMEISLVAVPANPSALMLGVKGIEGLAGFLKEYESDEASIKEPMEGDPCEMEDGSEGVLTMEDGAMVCKVKAKKDDEPADEEPKPAEETTPQATEPEPEAKGMTEDVLEATRAMREVKYKYADQAWMAFDTFLMAYFSDAVKVEDVKTLADELANKIQEIGATTPDQLPGTPMWCGFDNASKTMIEFSAKAGRVLSSKNRDIIKSQIDSLGSVIAALQGLHDATQPEGDDGADKSVPKNERSSEPATPTLDAIKLYDRLKDFNAGRKVLREINVATSEALRKYNQRQK